MAAGINIHRSGDGKTITVTVSPNSTLDVKALTDEDALQLAVAGMQRRILPAEAAEAIRAIKSPEILCQAFRKAVDVNDLSAELCEAFHILWTEKGHRIREAFGDDQDLADILRYALPPYVGPGLVIYRGEQAARFAAGQIGLNWTRSQRVAQMFASGLCTTYTGGGVLLQAYARPDAFISGSSKHSINLGEEELVVDPRHLERVVELVRFPEKDGELEESRLIGSA